MLAKTIKYTDFNGNEQEETFYFHLTKLELTDLAVDESGFIEKIQGLGKDATKGAEIVKTFRTLIKSAYGVRSEDGKSFRKSPEAQEDFAWSAAYDQLLMDLLMGDDDPIAFMMGILPADLAKEAKEKMDEQAGKPQDFRKKAGQ